MTREYEALYIIDPRIEEEAIKGIVEKIKTLIESSAEFKNIDEWGKRKLAYPINKANEGYYVLVEFSANPEFPHELERVFKITDGVLKYLIVKKD